MTPPLQTSDLTLDQRRTAQELNGGPLASGIFGATPTPSNPGQPMPDPQPRVGAFEPPPIPGGGGIFSSPNVGRGENVPDWMVNNPDFNPMAISSTVMREHTNPATGESYMGTGAGQYMVDPSLQGEFTTPDRSFSLGMGEIPGGGGIFSSPNVGRGENVPDWMVNNPDFDPRSPSQSGMQEYTNPATGETYMGSTSSNNQYMLDPSLQGEFTTPDRSFSLGMGEIPEARNGSPGEGVGPTFGTQQPEVQDFGAQHRAQHEAMGDNGGGNYFGNGGGGGSMGGGVMGLPSALSFQNSYSMPTWMNSSAMNNPFNFASPGGYQTSSPFGSMSSPFGGGLPRGYYT